MSRISSFRHDCPKTEPSLLSAADQKQGMKLAQSLPAICYFGLHLLARACRKVRLACSAESVGQSAGGGGIPFREVLEEAGNAVILKLASASLVKFGAIPSQGENKSNSDRVICT